MPRSRLSLVLGAAALATLLAAATSGGSGHGPLAAPAVRSSATVWALGDAYPTPGARRLARLVRRSQPGLFLYLGDVYDTGTAAEFRTRYDPLYGPLARRTLPTIGNHEYANRATGYRPYWRAKTGRAMNSWRARRIAGWEILMLSSEARHDAGSRQLAWLRRAVRAPGTCRIAITHRPRYSTGWHGDQADMQPIWAALRGHARLLISGHDHDLQRMADHQGLRQLVSGAGGHANIPIARRSALALRFAERTPPGGLRMRLSRGRALLDFVSPTGRLLDRSVVTCAPLG